MTGHGRAQGGAVREAANANGVLEVGEGEGEAVAAGAEARGAEVGAEGVRQNNALVATGNNFQGDGVFRCGGILCPTANEGGCAFVDDAEEGAERGWCADPRAGRDAGFDGTTGT